MLYCSILYYKGIPYKRAYAPSPYALTCAALKAADEVHHADEEDELVGRLVRVPRLDLLGRLRETRELANSVEFLFDIEIRIRNILRALVFLGRLLPLLLAQLLRRHAGGRLRDRNVCIKCLMSDNSLIIAMP